MAPSNQFTLSSGHSIPWLAYGNGSGAAKEVAEEATRWAIDAGLAHLDTAQGYASSKGSNEAVTGQAIAPYDRSKLYITTKISQEGGKPWNPPVPLNDLRTSVLKSIERLGGQPDLLLIHSPRVIEKGKMKEYWQVLERMRDEAELTADLGISNFRPQDIEELMSIARIKPVLHQLEFHPFVLSHLQPVLDLHARHDITTAAYGPLTPILRHPTKGGRLKPVLERIAKEHGVDAGAVLLLWTRAKGVVAVTTSSSKERLEGTAKLQEHIDLNADEVEEIDRVGRQVHFRHYTEHLDIDFPTPDLPIE